MDFDRWYSILNARRITGWWVYTKENTNQEYIACKILDIKKREKLLIFQWVQKPTRNTVGNSWIRSDSLVGLPKFTGTGKRVSPDNKTLISTLKSFQQHFPGYFEEVINK